MEYRCCRGRDGSRLVNQVVPLKSTEGGRREQGGREGWRKDIVGREGRGEGWRAVGGEGAEISHLLFIISGRAGTEGWVGRQGERER